MAGNDILVNFGASTAGLTAGITRAKKALTGMSRTASTSAASMSQNISESMRRMGNTLVGAAGSAMVGFVYPLTTGLREIIEVGKETEDSIQRVMSVFNNIKSPAAFSDLKEDMVDFVSGLAGQTKYDFNEISEAMYTMAQSGKQANEIFALTPEILKLSTAQMAEIDDTTQLTIASLNAYDIAVEDTARVTNALAAATSNTMLRLNDIAVSSRYVNSALSGLYGDDVFERGLAMTGMLRNWGYTGMQSGRIIRDIFQSLLNPTAEVERILEKNNIQIYKNSEEINRLKNEYYAAEDALSEMKISGSASTEQIKAQEYAVADLKDQMQETYSTGLIGMDELLNEFVRAKQEGMTVGELYALGGKQSGGAFNKILENIDVFHELTDSITGTSEAERQYEIQTKTLAYQLEILRSTIVEIKRSLYESIKEPLMEITKTLIANKDTFIEFGQMFLTVFVDKLKIVADSIIGVVKWFNNLNETQKKFIAGAAGTVAAIGLIIAPLLLLLGIISWNVSAILGLGSEFLKLPAKVAVGNAAITGFTKSLKPIKIYEQAAAVKFLGRSYNDNLTYFKNFDFSLKNIIKTLGKLDIYLTNGIDKVLLFGKTLGVTFIGKIKGVPGKITDLSDKIWKFDNAAKASGNTIGFLKNSFMNIATKIPILGGALTALSGVTLTTVIPTILALTASLAPYLLIIGAVIAATVLLYTAVRDNWQGIGDFIGGTVEYVLKVIKPFTDAIFNTIDAFGNLFDALKSGTSADIVGGIGEVIGSVVRIIGSIPYTILTTLGTIIGDVARIIGDWLGQVGKDVADKGIGQFLYEIAMSIINGAIEMGSSFVDGFIKGIMGSSGDDKVVDEISNPDKMEAAGEADGASYANGLNEGISENLKTLAEIKAEKESAMMEGKGVITEADRPEEYPEWLQAEIDKILNTRYSHIPTIGEAQVEAYDPEADLETREINAAKIFEQLKIKYDSENAKIQKELISELVALKLPRFDENVLKNSIAKVAHEGGYGYEQGIKEDYKPAAENSANALIESTSDAITIKSAETMPSVGATISDDIGEGIIANNENYKEKVSSINQTTEASMNSLIVSANGWGSQFVLSLVSGIDSQFGSFMDRINSMKSAMTQLQFIANPDTAVNASLLGSLETLNTNIGNLSGGGGSNITINITGNTFSNEEGLDASEIGDIVETKILNINRRVTI